MIQISELRQVLAEEVTRLQPPSGLENRVLERALGTLPAGEAGRQRGSGVHSPRVMALIAALIAIAIVATLVFTAHALKVSRDVQVGPGPTASPVPKVTPIPITALQTHSVSIQPGPTGGVYIRQPIPLKPPASAPCALQSARYGCMGQRAPVFGSPNVGWSTNGSAAPEGPTNLYSTLDGGGHWKAQVSWDYFEATDMKVSPDGRKALIISGWGWQGPGLFYTSDAGTTWTSMGFPLSPGQAAAFAATPSQKNCKGTILCSQDPGYFPYGQIYFLNPTEGWVLTQEPSFSVADLFHTTDGGARWTLSAQFDITAQFNLDLATGVTFPLPSPLPSGKKYVAPVVHQLSGQLVFQSSSAGWFIPDYSFYPPSMSLSIFRTLDGGASWRVQAIEAPAGLNASNAHVAGVRPFNELQAILEMGTNQSGQTYLYTTSDGGASWSSPKLLPVTRTDFIDAQHWVASPADGHLIRTTDGGQHWSDFATDLPGSASFQFIDVNSGWAYTGSALLGTTDGGVHWVKLAMPPAG